MSRSQISQYLEQLSCLSLDAAVLTPYTQGHGPTHSHRYVRNCQSVVHGRRTHETWPSNQQQGLPVAEPSVFISDLSGEKPRWVNGHMTVVHDPLRTVSVLEPGGPGGCKKDHRVTVQDTAEAGGCMYALNAGFFNTTTDGCLGNVVSDGKLVRDSRGRQNAQFGIRRDGSLVFGYLSQAEVLDQQNPFVQLVSGVVWLLRNGEVYINQSLKAECSKLVDQEVFRDFADVLSARAAVGHDKDGNLVLFHVDGETLVRGMNLWEVAEFMKKNGVINAINLDGGGSTTFLINGTLASYPPDICTHDSRWRCPRAVSTILCVHRPRCQPGRCSGHGECVDGRCRCQDGWRGDGCDSLVCQPDECSPRGVCTPDGCLCYAGWSGKNCNKACPPGFFGLSCAEKCQCENQCSCDPLTGSCAVRSDKGRCLNEKVWIQLDKALAGGYNLSELTWLIIILAVVVLLSFAVQRARCRWIFYGYFLVPSLREINRQALPAPVFLKP
ncbi:N-acetylglucosamine-1-phosphodiester alpha-N-acetylglucosaminidase-like [Halichoeres trimaculatus]|uniref:N-acetylglucosamine-1-phosphodiester alpha-N-acetylglucosaminidase-like n=1 Tax=Halichoeres trimaculatus TaxID=147232 RepID=UPI003D9E423C